VNYAVYRRGTMKLGIVQHIMRTLNVRFLWRQNLIVSRTVLTPMYLSKWGNEMTTFCHPFCSQKFVSAILNPFCHWNSSLTARCQSMNRRSSGLPSTIWGGFDRGYAARFNKSVQKYTQEYSREQQKCVISLPTFLWVTTHWNQYILCPGIYYVFLLWTNVIFNV